MQTIKRREMRVKRSFCDNQIIECDATSASLPLSALSSASMLGRVLESPIALRLIGRLP